MFENCTIPFYLPVDPCNIKQWPSHCPLVINRKRSLLNNMWGCSLEFMKDMANVSEAEKKKLQKDVRYTHLFAVVECIEECSDGKDANFIVRNDDYLDKLMNLNICAHCGVYNNIPGTKFQVCSKCKCVHYCSTKCLHDDWPHHKHNCVGCKTEKFDECGGCDLGYMVGKLEFESKDHKREFWNQGRETLKSCCRMSRMKRGLNDFILDMLGYRVPFPAGDLVRAGKTKALHPEHESFILSSDMQKDERKRAIVHPESCLARLIQRHKLRGRVFIFFKPQKGKLHMVVCEAEKLRSSFKRSRNRFKTAVWRGRDDGEKLLDWIERRALMGDHLNCLEELVERLKHTHDNKILFGFIGFELPLVFFDLSADRLLPYGRMGHDAMFARADFGSETLTEPLVEQQRYRVYDGPIDFDIGS